MDWSYKSIKTRCNPAPPTKSVSAKQNSLTLLHLWGATMFTTFSSLVVRDGVPHPDLDCLPAGQPIGASAPIGCRPAAQPVTRWLGCLVVIVLACAGCSTIQYEKRPFFLEEQAVETHGRKTWFDRLVEFDPGKIKYQVADD